MKTNRSQGVGATDSGKIIEVDEGLVRSHLDKVLKETVEEALNALLDEEAERLCRAGRYERTPERRDTRA